MSAPESRLEVAALINHVANQIRQAWADAQELGNSPVMEFAKAEIEVAFEVEYAPSGKIKLWAVQIGADLSQKTTHRLKIECVALEKSKPAYLIKPSTTKNFPHDAPPIDRGPISFNPIIDPSSKSPGAPGLDLR